MDNAFFFHAAYVAAAVVYVAYSATLWWRDRALAERERRLDARAPRRGGGA